MSQSNEHSIPDLKRLSNAANYHGLRMLVYFSVFAAMDAWYEVSALLLANALSVIAALIVGAYLSGIFHEWGHFVGARISKSRSPIVRKPKGTFMFGFDMKKNTSDQFLWMSLGGPLGNLLLVVLVYVLLPIDSFGRAALLAMIIGKLVAVIVFEGPIIFRTFKGGDPQIELDKQLDNGALDKGQKAGYLATALLWVLVI
ncbi:MAG: hypothetical protein JKY88_07910 [Pseudomonadales bacterium]|nr:hypothetical protein [Pseudomonadales bacterium]